MKIAFFGTPDFTCEFLEILKNNDFDIRAIITGVDVHVGRKLVLTSPLPKKWGDQNNIHVFQPEKIDTAFIEILKQESWDIFVVIAYGKILPEVLITLPKYGTINVHYSLLPKYRGATPVESALLNQDKRTGVCIQHMVYELDAGAILDQKEVDIKETENHHELRTRLNKIAQPMLIDVLKNIEEKIKNKKEQDHTKKTICKKIKKTDGLVTLDEEPKVLYAKFRGYFGWPGIYFFTTKGSISVRVKITDAEFKNNTFIIKKVIPEGKKELEYSVFLKQQKENN